MPNTCCVTKCNGNYNADNKVHIFSFPKDVELLQKWIKAIPRENLVVTKNTKVCERHFQDGDIEFVTTFYKEETGETLTARLKIPRLRKGAIPSIFPNCPDYLSTTSTLRDDPDKKKRILEEKHINTALAESLQTKLDFEKRFGFQNFSQMIHCFKINQVPISWTMIEKNDNLMFFDINVKDSIPSFRYAIVINSKLQLSISFQKQHLLKFKDAKLPMDVTTYNEILDVLNYFDSKSVNTNSLEENIDLVASTLENTVNLVEDKFKFLIEFLIEQINFLKVKPVRYRYSYNMLIFSSLLYHNSPQAYKFIRNSHNLILPHSSTIRKVSSMLKSTPILEQQDKYFLLYAKQMFSKLNSRDINVFLMLNEIYMTPYMDYKGGNIVGSSTNNTDLATSAHVFMLSSISSSFKDVVHIFPVNHIVAAHLFALIKKIVLGLEDIGFTVIGVVTDNNSINRKAMSSFSDPPVFKVMYPHPADDSRFLFYVIDSVHIIKAKRNNWFNQKNGYFMYFPSFEEGDKFQTASLSLLRKLYDLESTQLLKFGFGLTRKALWPTNLERQNVSLALKIFNRNLVQGILELGEKQNLMHYKETANYITIFCNWWDIANVKSVSKGKFKRNQMCEPITNKSDDIRKEFLEKFINWLDRWEAMKGDNGRLSRETHSALRHTSQAYLNLIEYCSNNLNMSYLLLGKIQTDKLESRFGQYRSMSGDHYHISIRQLYETESKLRLSKELKLTSHASGSFNVNIFDDYELDQAEDLYESTNDIFEDIEVTDSDIDKVTDSLPIITYLAGYCAHTVHKSMKCSDCKMKLITDKEINVDSNCKLIKSCDRGGLLYPSEFVTNIVLHIYIITQKLISEKYELQFLKVTNQRNLVMQISEEILILKDMWDFSVCSCSYIFEKIITKIMKSAINTLLNNYCKLKNDIQHGKKSKAKITKSQGERKLKTLTSGETLNLKKTKANNKETEKSGVTRKNKTLTDFETSSSNSSKKTKANDNKTNKSESTKMLITLPNDETSGSNSSEKSKTNNKEAGKCEGKRKLKTVTVGETLSSNSSKKTKAPDETEKSVGKKKLKTSEGQTSSSNSSKEIKKSLGTVEKFTNL